MVSLKFNTRDIAEKELLQENRVEMTPNGTSIVIRPVIIIGDSNIRVDRNVDEQN